MTGVVTAVMLTASLASCMSESSDDVKTNAQGRFTLNISSMPVGAGTRTVTKISGTDAQTGTKADGEKTINRLVMAVYDASNSDALLMGKAVPSPTGTAFQVTQTFASGGLAEGDPVVVAANIPESKLTSYAAYDPMSSFVGAPLTLEEALTPGTAGTLNASDLPMYGKGSVTADDSEGNFSATVNLRHLVAKVALNSLTVDFSQTLHTSASFTPEAIFLINVPEKIDMQVDADGNYLYQPTVTDFYQGEANNWSTDASANQRKFADYLGTGAITETALSSANTTMINKYWLYTLPNNSDTYKTKLVIKGKYSIDGSEAAKHDAYYAVPLGKSTSDQTVQINTIYQVSVTIKGDGADSPYDAIPNYQDLQATVYAADWTESGSVITAGTGGMSYAGVPSDAPVVGDLYFSDGTWGTKAEYPSKTPIGIVFSTSTSAADQALGYNRGYVMALRNVVYDANAAEPWKLSNGWCADIANVDGASHNLREVSVTGEAYKTDLAAVQGDMDGLTHCLTAKAAAEASANYTLADLYAIYAATTTYEAQVKAPASTAQLPNSGWYLPSIGQQYLWLTNLAGLSTSSSWTADTQNPIRYWYITGAAPGAAQTNAIALNAALTTAGLTAGTDFDAFTKTEDPNDTSKYECFWSSTERTGSYPFNLDFDTNGNLYLDGSNGKSDADRQVRAVLAF